MSLSSNHYTLTALAYEALSNADMFSVRSCTDKSEIAESYRAARGDCIVAGTS